MCRKMWNQKSKGQNGNQENKIKIELLYQILISTSLEQREPLMCKY